MENLASDEKTTMVMMYTLNTLVRGEVVTKENARVGVWPRTQGVPNLIRVLKPGVLLFGGSPPKALSYAEIFVPTASMIGFHLAPPLTEALDYDENEKNRSLVPVSLLMGTFIVKGHVRIASSATLANSLELVYNGWLSIYNSEISNPFLPQMPPVQVQMMLVSPNRINFMV
ncbi:MAG: hypothetical protein NTW32_17230 [Chloroflexi bacterium]|nr:hypothetical protein [Chloroflexota bacterium]